VSAPLTLGTYVVDAPCPDCGTLVELVLRLSTTLTTSTDEDPRLRLKARSTAVPHLCRRAGNGRPVTIDEAIDEALQDTARATLPVIVDADLVRTGDAGPDVDEVAP
jgi:hypothetical protein